MWSFCRWELPIAVVYELGMRASIWFQYFDVRFLWTDGLSSIFPSTGFYEAEAFGQSVDGGMNAQLWEGPQEDVMGDSASWTVKANRRYGFIIWRLIQTVRMVLKLYWSILFLCIIQLANSKLPYCIPTFYSRQQSPVWFLIFHLLCGTIHLVLHTREVLNFSSCLFPSIHSVLLTGFCDRNGRNCFLPFCRAIKISDI